MRSLYLLSFLAPLAVSTFPAAAQAQRAAEAAATVPLGRRLIGTWHHGDARVRDADSLKIILRADSTFLRTEKFRSLGADGWRVRRRTIVGRWEVRIDDRGDRGELCMQSEGPSARERCDPFIWAGDAPARLQYAGRHWLRGTELPKSRPAKRSRAT